MGLLGREGEGEQKSSQMNYFFLILDVGMRLPKKFRGKYKKK